MMPPAMPRAAAHDEHQRAGGERGRDRQHAERGGADQKQLAVTDPVGDAPHRDQERHEEEAVDVGDPEHFRAARPRLAVSCGRARKMMPLSSSVNIIGTTSAARPSHSPPGPPDLFCWMFSTSTMHKSISPRRAWRSSSKCRAARRFSGAQGGPAPREMHARRRARETATGYGRSRDVWCRSRSNAITSPAPRTSVAGRCLSRPAPCVHVRARRPLCAQKTAGGPAFSKMTPMHAAANACWHGRG